MRLSRFLWFALLAAAPGTAFATPVQFVPVDDPIVSELRLLDLFTPSPAGDRVRLPHLHSGPLQWQELQGPARDRSFATGPRGITLARIERALQREADPALAAPPAPRSTPRLLQHAWPGATRVEFSIGLEGGHELTRDPGQWSDRWRDGSGVHTRFAIQVDRWLAYSHIMLGQWRGVQSFSDALVTNSDLAANTEDSYLAYSAGRAWSAQLGRGRWNWGPGEAGSLLLSRTAAPISGLMLHLRVEPLRADASFFNATVEPGAGEQLAAHRLEWQVRDGVRLGLAESARYHAGGWQGVYLAGVIPYSISQRLLNHEHADTSMSQRNNVMIGADASVRVADGSRIYAEVLVDDLHSRWASNPDKFGWQLGWDGVGEVTGTRLSWNCEYTWLSRFAYTSFFGRAYVAQGQPLGFPTGPGSRRARARVAWDPGVTWQCGLLATRTTTGTEGVSDPFVFGDPVPDVHTLAGTPQRVESLEGSLRWWPASGADLSLRVAREWTTNDGHVAGAQHRRWRCALAFQFTR